MKINIVVPTRNEESNIGKLLAQINAYKYEVVVVDDSEDATPAIAKQYGAKVIQGQRKGLGQAIIDGIQASDGGVVVVMDADGSHSPDAIPSLLKPILEQGCDLVIGSRYVKGGDFSKWDKVRQLQSLIGVKLMQSVTGVRDSNSGFFAFRRSILDGVELKPLSWKIMLEVLFRGKWLCRQEVPITFNDRLGGVSKNSNKERIRHAKHLIRLLAWKYGRFINFAFVGGVGAVWYFAILYALTEYTGLWYGFSAVAATLVAMTNNYLINHYYTFRHVKHHNTNLLKGWFKYLGNSAIGDGVDWLVLVLMTEVFGIWYMLSAFLASGIACIIKYAIASRYIWGKGKSALDADYEWHSFYKGLPWQKFSKQLIAKTVKEIVGKSGITVDIGCGSSPLGLLVDHSDYIGLDLDKKKIGYMSSKQLSGCRFIYGSVLDIPLPYNSADTVLFIETIEHLESRQQVVCALDQIRKALRTHGRLVIAMPDFSSLPGRIMERAYKLFHPQAYADDHKMKLDFNTLVMLCKINGFRIERVINLLKRDIIVSCIKR